MGGLKQFIASIPKTEIHLHVEMCVSPRSYETLMDKYDIPRDEATSALTDFSRIVSLQSMIESFYFLQGFFREAEDFQLVVDDVISYARANNIYYIEAFVSPSMVLNRGLVSFDQMITTLLNGFSRAYDETGVDVRLIVDVSRSFGPKNASRNLDLTQKYLKKYPTDRLLGIGLGGQESGHPCAEYEEVFAKARKGGLHVVAHAGEEVGPESVWEALDLLKVERVGHGVSSIQDKKLMARLKDDQVPLEICPMSNIITKKYFESYEKHPIRTFFDEGLYVTLNTDDPILFAITLNQEYENIAEKIGFSRDELMLITRNNLMATFLPEEQKQKHWHDVQKAVGRA